MIAALVGLAVMIVVALGIGHAILQPVTQAVKKTSQRTQFRLIDFVWLLVQLQLVLAAVVGYVPRTEMESFTILMGFGFIAALVMWWGAVNTMLQAGVHGIVRRGVFVVFLLPTVVALMMCGAFLVVAVPFALVVEPRSVGLENDVRLLGAGALVLGLALLALFCWLLRLVARWIVSEEKPLLSATPAPPVKKTVEG